MNILIRSTAVIAWLLGAQPMSAGYLDDPGTGEVRESPLAIPSESIENLYRLGPSLFSGGDPIGEAGFRELRHLGVRTIISVDGASPDIQSARRQGLRYVHLPIGYDRIPAEQATRIVKAMRTLPGPVFVHCHHGKHRGPSAAALCGVALDGWSADDAIRWLETAGTSREYPGLYDSVASFTMPTDEELDAAGELPERAEVRGLVEAMIEIDARWETLRAIREAGFRVPPEQPDVDPRHEATMLRELLREAVRLPESDDRGPEFLAELEQASGVAAELEAWLRRVDPRANSSSIRRVGEEAYKAVAQSCTTCHVRFRN